MKDSNYMDSLVEEAKAAQQMMEETFEQIIWNVYNETHPEDDNIHLTTINFIKKLAKKLADLDSYVEVDENVETAR